MQSARGTRLATRFTMAGLVLLAPVVMAGEEGAFILHVPARQIPVPATVSQEVARLPAEPVPGVAVMPTTPEDWRAYQDAHNTRGAELTRKLAEQLGVTIEPAQVAGVSCFRVVPQDVPAANEQRLILHVHGGAYVLNSGLSGAGEAVLLADACKTRVRSVDYRVPPDHPFPAAPDDVLAVWKAVAAERDPHTVAIAGTSAGAGLIMTTMLRVQELNLPRPAALFLGTPGADLTKRGDSLFVNAEVDHQLGRYEGRAESCIKLYAAGRDLKDPLLSPLYGDLSGFPPTVLISGTRDLLLSPTILTHRKLRAAGITAELHVYEGQSHADYLAAYPAPESRDALREIAQFFDRHLK